MTTVVKAKAATRKIRSFGKRLTSQHRATEFALPPESEISGSQHVDPLAVSFIQEESPAVLSPNLGWKRALDISFILLSLPVALPLMMIIILWVKLASPGPSLFRQKRIGKDGKTFILYKFRSMRHNASTGCHQTYLRNLVKTDSPMVKLDLFCDSRLITGGCLLRAAGLDELPQLLNVLKGEMSLVGPRPCLPQEYGYFSESHRERFNVLPGLTGLWQVSAKNRATFSEMNAMDIDYVRTASLGLDLSIILRTPAALLLQMWQAIHHQPLPGKYYLLNDSEPPVCCSTQKPV